MVDGKQVKPQANYSDKNKPTTIEMKIDNIVWEYSFSNQEPQPYCATCQTPLTLNRYYSSANGYYDTYAFCDTCKKNQNHFRNKLPEDVLNSVKNQMAGKIRRETKTPPPNACISIAFETCSSLA